MNEITLIRERFNLLGEEFNWSLLESTNKKSFEEELNKEIGTKHSLFGMKANAIAKCDSNDDVLFVLSNLHYVIVHLTWANRFSNEYPRVKDFTNINVVLDYIEEQFKLEYL